MRIAILEDDMDQSDRISALLQREGHGVHVFAAGNSLLNRLRSESFDLIILDWEVPGISGFDVLRSIRSRDNIHSRVLFLTHRDNETDVVNALKEGADDFMIKPAREGELLARIEALGRRSRELDEQRDLLEVAPFSIDTHQHVIKRDGVQLELTRKEFEVAALLFKNLGTVLSRGQILEVVWGRSDATTTRTVDMHVSRVRQVLGLSAAIGLCLVAVYGYGYRLERIGSTTK